MRKKALDGGHTRKGSGKRAVDGGNTRKGSENETITLRKKARASSYEDSGGEAKSAEAALRSIQPRLATPWQNRPRKCCDVDRVAQCDAVGKGWSTRLEGGALCTSIVATNSGPGGCYAGSGSARDGIWDLVGPPGSRARIGSRPGWWSRLGLSWLRSRPPLAPVERPGAAGAAGAAGQRGSGSCEPSRGRCGSCTPPSHLSMRSNRDDEKVLRRFEDSKKWGRGRGQTLNEF